MHIVALGGGGFLMEPENPLLDQYLLSVARRPAPRVCFVPTASGDSENNTLRFFEAFSRLACEPTYLPLFRRRTADLRSFVLQQDVIYVGGGNTANLLAVWRVHGLDRIFAEALAAGVVLGGVSAGSLCWFEAGVTDSFGPGLARLQDGLGLLKGSHCPHYDGEAGRRPTYHRLLASGLPGGIAIDDGCAVHFRDGQVHRVVSSRPRAQAYRVALVDGEVREEPLAAEFLGEAQT